MTKIKWGVMKKCELVTESGIYNDQGFEQIVIWLGVAFVFVLSIPFEIR